MVSLRLNHFSANDPSTLPERSTSSIGAWTQKGTLSRLLALHGPTVMSGLKGKVSLPRIGTAVDEHMYCTAR
jgi:hypothetical protein